MSLSNSKFASIGKPSGQKTGLLATQTAFIFCLLQEREGKKGW